MKAAPLTKLCLLALGAVNAWLAASLLMGNGSARHASPASVTWTLRPPPERSADMPDAKPLNGYRETLARPLFQRTRAPFVPPASPPQPAPSVPAPPPAANPGIALGGVIINGVLRKAYLFSRGSPQGMWVGEGDSFMGWTVAAVDAGSAKLRQAERTIDVQLYETRR
jgi:hypothetical protein